MAGFSARRRQVRYVVWALVAVLALIVASLAFTNTADSNAEPELSATGVSNTDDDEVVKTWGPFRPFEATAGHGLDNGRTRIEQSLNCEAGGDGNYWHFSSEAPLEAGVITGPESALPGDLRMYADVHSPHHGVRSQPEPVPGPDTASAMLAPDSSHISLSNQRGTIKLGLAAGGCPDRDDPDAGFPLDFDGITAATADSPGAWRVISSSGSYREAEDDGAGTFDLTADVSPGADNPWLLDLRGALRVLQPELDVEIVETFWGRDGVNYLQRQLGVTYEITNIGAGDAFDVRLIDAFSPTPGATLISIFINGDNLFINGNTPVGAPQRMLGDLFSGETVQLSLKWQLPLPSANPPCVLVILGCEIDTTLEFSVPDAMDVPVTPNPSFTPRAKAPDLPPPG